MGNGQGAASRAPDGAREGSPGAVWCDAAEQVRLIVRRLPMPSHVAGYLRGYADSLEFHCALGAGVDTSAGDVVDSRAGRLAAYACEPAASSCADVTAQRRTIEAAARMGLFTVSSWHEDHEASSENRRSPGIQEARAAIKAGDVGGIVVAELARLGRNSLDVLDLVDRANTEGWRLVALDCRLDTATPSGRLVVETLLAARRMAWRKVSPPTRTEAGPGSRRQPAQARPDGVDAAVANRIAAMRAGGHGYRAIAAALNDDGVPGPSRGRWGAGAVRAVLQAGRGSA